MKYSIKVQKPGNKFEWIAGTNDIELAKKKCLQYNQIYPVATITDIDTGKVIYEAINY